MRAMRSGRHATSILGVAILLFVLAIVTTPTAWAASRTQTLVNQANCQSECTTNLRSCTSGCCGTTTCGKTCLGVCDATYNTCVNICGFAALDGAFFDTATLSPNGRLIHVGGPLSCPEGATADLHFTLTQADGAVATGQVKVQCPAGDTSYTAVVHTKGKNAFEPFTTTQACGLARIHAANLSLNAFQWCRDITVVPEGIDLED